MNFAAVFKQKRWYIARVSVLAALGAACLAAAPFVPSSHFGLPVVGGMLLTMALAAYWRGDDTAFLRCPEAAEWEYQTWFDRYTHRSVSWLLITFLAVFAVLPYFVDPPAETQSAAAMWRAGCLAAMAVPAGFLLHNRLIVHWLTARHALDRKARFLREYRKAIVFSAIFWAVVYGVRAAFWPDAHLAAAALFAAWVLAYNLTQINRFTYQKKRLNGLVLAVDHFVGLVTGAYAYLFQHGWLIWPYIQAVPRIRESACKILYDGETGVYTIIRSDGDFRILQLTDIHLGGGVLSHGRDLKALKAVFALLNATKPDLVVVTGDLTYPAGLFSIRGKNAASIRQFAALMRNVGIPWAFTYGNHDTQNYTAAARAEIGELYMSLSRKGRRNLLYPRVQPGITGRNNQLIEIRNGDGTLNQALFLIDSNDYTRRGQYDYVHDDQVDWYRGQVLRMNAEAGRTVPSMVFIHIPLQQYKTAYQLYEQGSDQVTWHFGVNEEVLTDRVCCSEFPSALFDTARELGSTTGFFCGHDHYNNMSLEYRGIRLTYGMSIDYLTMPGIARDTRQRGGTLITLRGDGGTDIVQVPLTSVTEARK